MFVFVHLTGLRRLRLADDSTVPFELGASPAAGTSAGVEHMRTIDCDREAPECLPISGNAERPVRARAVGFQIWNAEGFSVLTNLAFRELFGAAPPPEYNCLRDEVAAEQGVLAEIRRAFAGETVRTGPIWYDARERRHVTTSEGRRIAIECTLFPLLDEAGNVTHVAGAFKDVTAEVQLRTSQEHLRL